MIERSISIFKNQAFYMMIYILQCGIIIYANELPVKNGGFENWIIKDTTAYKGWDISSGLFPEAWEIEARPEEKGYLRRLEHHRFENKVLGKYYAYLNGKILIEPDIGGLGGKTLQISYWAKGENGRLITRIREYSAKNSRSAPPVYGILSEEDTNRQWRYYATSVKVHPAYKFIKIEFEGHNIFLDQVQIKEVAENNNTTWKSSRKIIHIPINKGPVNLDGTLSAEEWDKAIIISNGFMNIFSHFLVKQQTEIRLTSDQQRLYIAGKMPVPPGGLNSKCVKRDGKVWEDDSLEIHINPTFNERPIPCVYQIIFNLNGIIFDQARKLSIGQNEVGWNCEGLEIATKSNGSYKFFELSLPLEALNLRINQPFGLNIARTIRNPPEFSSLSGGKYGDYENMIKAAITPAAPAITMSLRGDLGTGELGLSSVITNSCEQARFFDINLQLADICSLKKEFKEKFNPLAKKTFSVGTGRIKLPEARPLLKVTDTKGRIQFLYSLNYNRISLKSIKVKAKTEQDYRIEYYPIQKKINIRLPKIPDEVKYKREHFTYGKIDILIYQKNADQSLSLIQKNSVIKPQIIESEVHTTIPFSPSQNGQYQVTVLVHDKDERVLKVINDIVTKINFPWLNNRLGKESVVISPFTPLKVNGKSISCWGRNYQFLDSGLIKQIISSNKPVFSAPMKIIINSVPLEKTATPWNISKKAADHVIFNSVLTSGPQNFETENKKNQNLPTIDLKVEIEGKIEYDGLVHYRMKITPEHSVTIHNLTLRFHLKDGKYFHTGGNRRHPRYYMMDCPEDDYIDDKVKIWQEETVNKSRGGTYYFPDGDGKIWSSLGVRSPDIINDFLPFFWVGNHDNGFCWLADNDKGWHLNSQKATFIMKREGNNKIMDINIVSSPYKMHIPLTLNFAVMATPFKPRLTGTNVSFRIGVMAFPNFYQREAQQGFTCNDFFLAKQVYSNMKKHGLSSNVYVCGNLTPLGDPFFKNLFYEWANLPLSFYEQELHSLQYKICGPEKENYISVYTCAEPSRCDYTTYRINEWVTKTNAGGLYLDNSYPYASTNIQHANGAYIHEEGRIQGVYHLFDKRNFIKRCAIISSLNKSLQPRTAIHMTDMMIPACFSFADLFIDGEFAMSKEKDYIDAVPLARMEIFGAGAWGGNQGWLPKIHDPALLKKEKPTRTFFALVKLFDMWLWRILLNRQLHDKFKSFESKFGIDKPDCEFIGYWDDRAKNFLILPKGIKASYYIRKNKGALVYISNLTKKPVSVPLNFNLYKYKITELVKDAETGKIIDTPNITIQEHDLRAIIIGDI